MKWKISNSEFWFFDLIRKLYHIGNVSFQWSLFRKFINETRRISICSTGKNDPDIKAHKQTTSNAESNGPCRVVSFSEFKPVNTQKIKISKLAQNQLNINPNNFPWYKQNNLDHFGKDTTCITISQVQFLKSTETFRIKIITHKLTYSLVLDLGSLGPSTVTLIALL